MRRYYNLIIALAIVSIILGGALFYPAQKSDIGYSEKSSDGNIHIRITETGFEPKNILVRKGDSVLWTNEGKNKHWPASNDHPTHRGYPQKSNTDCAGSSFDSCGGIEQDSSWQFTFEQEGVWRYHDHLFPSLTGEIEVGDSKNENKNFLYSLSEWWDSTGYANCPSPDKFQAMRGSQREILISEMAKKSPKKAWRCLKSSAMLNGAVTLNVHDLAHIIGNESYRRSGIEGVSICDTTFAYGCFHGVTEEMLRELGPEVALSASRKCRTLFPANSPRADSYTGCLHGMGHGLLAWENMDLGRGLAHCEKLDKQDRDYCFDGVFMEYSSGAYLKEYKENDPWAVCRSLGAEFQRACARYQPNTWKRVFGWTTAKAAAMCIKGDTEIMRDNCIDSIGFITAQLKPGSKESIMEECGKIENYEYVAKCETASALENKFQRYNGWEELTKDICGALKDPWGDYCASRVK